MLCAGAGCGTDLFPDPFYKLSLQSPSGTDAPLDGVLPADGVVDPPQLRISATPLLCCDAFERAFEATLEGQDLASAGDCHWDFDDGHSAQGCRVRHRFGRAGEYRISVIVSLPDGATLLDELVLTLDSPESGATGGVTGSVGINADGASDLMVDAGPDIEAQPGDIVQLGGDVVTSAALARVMTRWTQTGGPFVVLAGADTLNPSFTAPAVVVETVLQFEFTGTLDGRGVSDVVAVRILPVEPQIQNSDVPLPFDPVDATDAVQEAIDSAAGTVVIPYTGRPWIVRPLTLRSGLRLELMPGVVLQAKAGDFRGTHDSLLSGEDVRDVTIVGYGATLRMRKSDYVSDDYEKSEWRHGIRLLGATNVEVLGLRIERSGGDGIYIGPTSDARRWPCSNIRIEDVTLDENFRQGISIVSGIGVVIENCLLSGTSGTAPQAGLNLEPSAAGDRLTDIYIHNCVARGNAGSGFMTNLSKLSGRSKPVNVLIESCTVLDSVQPGLRAILRHDEGARGTFEFLNCNVDGTRFAGAAMVWDTGSPVRLAFTGCRWSRVARREGEPALFFDLTRKLGASPGGGIQFTNALLVNDRVQDTLEVVTTDPGMFADVRGTMVVSGVRPQTLTHPVLPNMQVTFQDGG